MLPNRQIIGYLQKISITAKKKNTDRPNDLWIRLSGIGLLTVNFSFNSRIIYSSNWLTVVKYVGLNILLITGLLEGCRFIIFSLRSRFPTEAQNRRRLMYTIALNTLYIFFVLYFLFYFFGKSGEPDMPAPLLTSLMSGFVLSVFIVSIYEAAFSYHRVSKVEAEKKELMRINLQGQFDSLKGQVNPHFLFNSLNSLRQLVLKNPEQAARYVEEMSDVYRYLLRNNDSELTPLKNELDFIQSYCHLLKTRFGEGLQVSINVDEPFLQYCLPPLTLQMLFENCVKHNVISTTQPLHIKVRTNGAAHLQVSNNLQKKMQTVQSEKIGLANIITKYRYLGQPDVTITETADEFIVTLPLIKKTGI